MDPERTRKPVTRDDVIAVLQTHIGADAGITAEALAVELAILPRQVRGFISELRREGYAICAHPSTGYYVAQAAEEIERTCAFLRARAMHSLELESRLRRIPLPELLGQLRVPT
jgi:biotin operon repressor